jgi:hypothetical protein
MERSPLEIHQNSGTLSSLTSDLKSEELHDLYSH